MRRARLGVSVNLRAEGSDSIGALIQSVTPNSPAARAGLQSGDIITRFSGKPLVDEGFAVGSNQSAPGLRLIELAAALEPGDTVRLDYRRGASRRTTAVVAGDEPAYAWRTPDGGSGFVFGSDPEEAAEAFRRAFAVVDHQAAHVYVRDPADVPAVAALLGSVPGVAHAVHGAERAAWGVDHECAGEVVLVAAPGTWFTYYYWLDDARAPDFAPTVDIHRKPGYDPCELFCGKSRLSIAWTLFRRRLGFRALLDVTPLDASLVKGSHGRPPDDPAEGPLLLGDGDRPRAMSEVKAAILGALAQ